MIEEHAYYCDGCHGVFPGGYKCDCIEEVKE
jgi:hypothetical protein